MRVKRLTLLSASLSLGLGACSSDKLYQKVQEEDGAVSTKTGPVESEHTGEDVTLPPQVGAVTPQAGERKTVRPFAVWVDSSANDSYAALGFLQELEKKGYKPAKVVGTGFGCWVAVSWALENSGNRAEWQSSKWKDWSLVDRTWLKRLAPRSDFGRFRDEVSKLFAPARFQDLKLPSDCPLVDKAAPASGLRSSTSQTIPEALWHSFHSPALTADFERDDLAWISGSLFVLPSADELEAFAPEANDGNPPAWLILRTQGEPAADCCGSWNALRAQRALPIASTGETSSGRAWRVQDLASGLKMSADDRRKPEFRRKALLWGRQKAREALAELEQNFLHVLPPVEE